MPPVRENITYVNQWKFIRPWGKCITNTAELLLESLGLFVHIFGDFFEGEVREGVDKIKTSLKFHTIQNKWNP